MKLLCVLVVFLLVMSPAVHAQDRSRVRALDAIAQDGLEHGLERSPLFQNLVAALDESDVIVHVVSACWLLAGAAGTTQMVAAAHGQRYVRIAIDARLRRDMYAATLGHELQHAVELARSEASDVEAVRVLYLKIGHSVIGTINTFDTDAAVEAGERVWTELHMGRNR